MEELWSLDQESFDQLKYIFTLLKCILLLKFCIFQASSWVDIPVQVASWGAASGICHPGQQNTRDILR